MYKYLLCWRYLKTRYIALASVISVMLGVATMIVVNSVMAGFAEKMRDRLHGVLADVVVESVSLDGFYNSDEVMARVRQVAGDQVVALAPTMETPGILHFRYPGGQVITRPVNIIGVRPEDRARTGDFGEFLVDDGNQRIAPSFEVTDQLKMSSPRGEILQDLGDDPLDKQMREAIQQQIREETPDEGTILGYALATWHRGKNLPDQYMAPPGTKVGLLFPKAGQGRSEGGYDTFTVVGYFKSGMSEYDSTHVYVPLERLQFVRNLRDARGRGAVNQIQIKAKPNVPLGPLAEKLQLALDRLHPAFFRVFTWEQKQGALLGAVAIEQSILNILLFFIIAVAGFGILAIFSMIVVEKTRDIGVMKALGASTAGIRGIFLGYGLLLGAVGSGVGMVGGLLFVRYINEIESVLSKVMHHKVFDDTIYYFDKIPTLIQPFTVCWIVAGALVIAVTASIWPAHRAAHLHPVRSLRYE
ncbi:MAG: ABC transporter permease [Isosphaerales bacterium]